MNFPKFDNKKVIKFEDGSNWAVVAEETNQFEAELIKGKLESENIDCEIISQLDSAHLILFGKNAIIKIYVKIEDYQKALDLLMSADFSEEDDILPANDIPE